MSCTLLLGPFISLPASWYLSISRSITRRVSEPEESSTSRVWQKGSHDVLSEQTTMRLCKQLTKGLMQMVEWKICLIFYDDWVVIVLSLWKILQQCETEYKMTIFEGFVDLEINVFITKKVIFGFISISIEITFR